MFGIDDDLLSAGIQGIASMFGQDKNAEAQRDAAAAQERMTQEQLQAQKDMQAAQLSQNAFQFTNTNARANKQLSDQEALDQARQQAYGQALGRGSDIMGQGEQALGDLTSKPLSELEQAKNDVLNQSARGLQQGAGQLQASLAQQGVRGGQAATQLRRGVGEMATGTQENLNQMALSDAQQRRAAQMAYQTSKAQAGLGTQTALPTRAAY